MEFTFPNSIIYALISLAFAIIYGLFMFGFVARIVARVHGRIGMPIWQPFLDIIKNYGKRTMISHGIMFYLGSVFRLGGGLGLYLFMPILYGSEIFANFSFSGDLLLLMYFFFFGQLGMALGAGESGHPYAAMGVSRGLSQMTAFEVPYTLAVISLVIQYKTLNIMDIVAAQQDSILNWTVFTNPLAVTAAILAMLGMNMHSPFDIVRAPQEIPVGPPVEHHSAFLGMLQTNRALFNVAKLILFMNLFFGGATNLIELMIKTFLIYMISVFVGVAFPRFRTEQSIRFFLGIPTIIGVLSIVLGTIK